MISIVIPIYNAANFIQRCLNSLLEQDFSDFEVVMINDGSTDNSEEVCIRYAESDSRFRYFRQENQGPDIARKEGVKRAEGEYLMFIDADDYVSKDILSVHYNKIVDTDADIVCSNVTRFNDNKKEWTSDKWPKEETMCSSHKEVFSEYFVTRTLIGCYYAKLYRTELFKDYGFVKNSLIGEDITGVLYALEKSSKVVLLPDSYYYYYWNLSSISHTKYNERHRVSLENYINLKQKIKSLEVVEEKYISGYFAEFEMAVATAMSRAKIYDAETAEILRNDLRKDKKCIKANKGTPLYMKMCILCYIFSPKLFIKLYRVVYKLTGR